MAKKKTPLEEAREKLNPKQRKFSELYSSGDTFGRGVDSYGQAYDMDITKVDKYHVAKTNASRLLSNANVLSYIRELMGEFSPSDALAESELGFLMVQRADFGTKLGAIKEYNQRKEGLTQRVSDQKVTVEIVTNDKKKTKKKSK